MFLVPLEGVSPSQSPNPRAEPQETHPALWALGERRVEKLAGERGGKAARPLLGAPPSCLRAFRGREEGETVWFPLLGQLCPHSHPRELKDETDKLPSQAGG